MKRLFATTLLSLFCCAANADWTLISESDSFKNYLDLKTWRKNNDVVAIWVLSNDLTTPQNNPALSAKALHELNCKDNTYRILSVTNYSGGMGMGNVIATQTDSNRRWDYVVPASMIELTFKAACSYKP